MAAASEVVSGKKLQGELSVRLDNAPLCWNAPCATPNANVAHSVVVSWALSACSALAAGMFERLRRGCGADGGALADN